MELDLEPGKLLYRPEEAAKALSVSRDTVYAEIAAGRMRSVKLGRSRRIPHGALTDYVAMLESEAEPVR